MRHPVGVLHTSPAPVMSLFGNALKLSATMLEAGLDAVDAGAKAVRAGIDSFTGTASATTHAPPVDGPRNLDTALSDFANQMVRLGWITTPGGVSLRQIGSDVVKSAQSSFAYLNPRDPRILALPFELPFSMGGLAAETILRSIALVSSVGVRKLPVFLNNAAEVYVDTALFIGLEYKQLMDRYIEQLKTNPQDHGTRFELGRLYLKCGRFDDAVRELRMASADPAVLPRARQESAIANLRAGRFAESVADAVDAMTADPANERARVNLWLASRSMGGYPSAVPESFRMELKAGYAPTRVKFENVAAKSGLDKICA